MEQTVNFNFNRQTEQVTDRNGKSRLQFTNENIFTCGFTIWNFLEVQVGLKIIVPEVCRMYMKETIKMVKQD